MEKKGYSIAEVSEMVDLREPTIRKYENDFKIKTPRNELGHRCYSEEHIEVLKQIKQFKDNGYTMHQITQLLDKSVAAIEHNEKALELVTIDKLTGAEIKKLLTDKVAEMVVEMVSEREEQLKSEYEEKLQQAKDEIREAIRREFAEQQEQRQMEHRILVRQIERTMEEKSKKGFWSNLFRKEEKSV